LVAGAAKILEFPNKATQIGSIWDSGPTQRKRHETRKKIEKLIFSEVKCKIRNESGCPSTDFSWVCGRPPGHHFKNEFKIFASRDVFKSTFRAIFSNGGPLRKHHDLWYSNAPLEHDDSQHSSLGDKVEKTCSQCACSSFI
jgi:hypothetical protein